MTSTIKTKNDAAWEKLFEKYKIKEHIDNEGCFIITSTQINEFREARLMTKFDNKKTLPNLFKKYKLSILPISANSYILANFKLYEDIPEITEPIEFKEFPSYIESIDYNKINSEAIALNCAYISKIIEDFLDEENEGTPILPTVNGKMSSGNFKFDVENSLENNTYSVEVDRSGIEIDAGYETAHSLVLVEAKNVIADDFLVRQLYYPFRLWKDKVTKNIRTVFMQYSNGVFNLYEYEFKNPNDYNSLELVKSKRYSIVAQDEMKISLEEILNIDANIKIVKEPDVPFPQADSFERVISLLEMLNTDTVKTKEKVTEEFQFDPRQTDYYFNAGKYLGFLEEDVVMEEKDSNLIKRPAIKLSSRGKNLFKISYKERQLEYVKAILEHKVFNQVFKDCAEFYEMPAKSKVVKIMQEAKLYNVNSDVTRNRRSSTVTSWINWILNLYE